MSHTGSKYFLPKTPWVQFLKGLTQWAIPGIVKKKIFANHCCTYYSDHSRDKDPKRGLNISKKRSRVCVLLPEKMTPTLVPSTLFFRDEADLPGFISTRTYGPHSNLLFPYFY